MRFFTAVLLALFHRGPIDPATDIMHIVVAPAETLSVSTTGTGTPIVIIPGMLGGAFGFRKVTAALSSEDDRVLVINTLGTGGSSRPHDADYSMQAQAVRVAAALDSLGIEKALVVGHAAGAPVAFRLALLRPELVSGIVAVNGSASEKFSTGGIRMAVRLAPILRFFGGQKKAGQRVTAGLRENSADASWVTSDVVNAYTASYRKDLTGTLRVPKMVATAKEPWTLLPRLAELRVPVLLVVGTGAKKPAVKPDEVLALRAALPQMRVDTLAAVGHFVQEERPDLLVRAIRSLH